MNPRGCAAGLVGVMIVMTVLVLSVRPSGPSIVVEASEVADILALPDGGFLYADRLRGQVREVDRDGELLPGPVFTATVATEGQRGMLGLAREASGRVFASWTGADEVLRVAQIDPGPTREVWRGPRTSDLGNGGRIAVAPDGRLVIGIGDMRRPDLVDDPVAPNGKLLALDPDGSATQIPEVVASGWNNPFAFDVLDDGSIWVADNEPGEGTERLARVGTAGTITTVTGLPAKTAPSGIAVTARSVFVCGYASGSLLRYAREAPSDPTVAADDCAYAVVRLSDGDILYASRDAILEL